MSIRISYELESLLPRLNLRDIQTSSVIAMRKAVKPLVSQYATNIAAGVSGKVQRNQRKTKSGRYRIPLAKGPASRVWLWKDGTGCTGIIGVRTREALYHAHLVDKGTNPRYTRAGKYRGIMPAFRYLQKALDQRLEECSRIYANEFIQEINKRL